MTEDGMHASLDAALARNSGPSAEDVEALAGMLSGAAPEYVALAIPTHIEQAKRLLASDWLTAHTAAAEARGAERGARAVVEAVEAAWSAIPNPQHPGTGAALRKAAHDAACVCAPCLGRGNDGHGLSHCAECCFGTGVEVDLACPVHGPDAAAREAAARVGGA